MDIQMKNNSIFCRLAPLYLIFPLLLSACHTAPIRPGGHDALAPNDANPGYIDPTKTIFPLDGYSQSVDKWLPPDAEDAHTPVIDGATQQRYFSDLKSRYFGMGPDEKSPWNPHYIAATLKKGAEQDRDININSFLGPQSQYWGENFSVHSARWKAEIRHNADTRIDAAYQASRRGIAVRETLVRVLPTALPAYGNPRLAGQGYPFDNLQMSAIRPGTPVYVLTDSRDKRWKYVTSPTVTGWVHSEDIASVDQAFITQWGSQARTHLGAIIKNPVSIHQGGQYYFTARPGTVLPFRQESSGQFLVAVPVSGDKGSAKIRWVSLQDSEFAAMPWKMTPSHMATLMKSMSGRPYGWGNYLFHNDCSAEMRSLLMPFGIFLPRNSAAQIQAASRVVDLTGEGISARISYLREHGKPFTTLIYIPGHIMLYIGNATINGQNVPMTYQNLWGLRPADSKSRSIIGGSVFFPLLTAYPENPQLKSLVDKPQFKLGFIE